MFLFQWLHDGAAEVIADFGLVRSVHVGVEAGKAMLGPFYGSQASTNNTNKSYFLACSLGGRQAIKAAEMFPEDFDGIVAGCPAVDFNNLYSWRGSFFPLTGANGSANFISSNTWKTTIHNEILRQCDTIDGVADGIIEDSSLCRFNPDMLLCGTGAGAGNTSTSACLNAAQVEVVRKIFSPYTWDNGTLIYPAMNPGGELITADGLYNGQPWQLSEDWFRYAVHNDPNWDPATYNLADAMLADQINPGGIRTYPSTLADFQNRGGKIVMFHGGQDNQLSSFNSPRFYEHLRSGMSYSTEQMDDFLRFFRISGMFHCQSGPGAWVLGQAGGAAAQGPFDREHNVLAAVVDWVEEGAAPETMTGTKYVNDTVSAGKDFQRRHCRWPLRNTYLGGGKDAKDPASWACQHISEADEKMGALGSEAAGNASTTLSGGGPLQVSDGWMLKLSVRSLIIGLLIHAVMPMT